MLNKNARNYIDLVVSLLISIERERKKLSLGFIPQILHLN